MDGGRKAVESAKTEKPELLPLPLEYGLVDKTFIEEFSFAPTVLIFSSGELD